MAVTINGDGTISGINVGGLPDGVVDSGTLATNSVNSAELIDGAIDSGHLASGVGGKIVQVVNTQTGAVITGTGTTVSDDTPMLNSEGSEFLTLAITPTSATHKLKIDVVAHTHHNHNTEHYQQAGIFQDTTASALAMSSLYPQLNDRTIFSFSHFMTSGTTSSTTFKLRMGSPNTGTLTMNGQPAGSRLFGGTLASSITITEIAV
jgi:hypothetical protein